MRRKHAKKPSPLHPVYVYRKPTWHWGLPLTLLLLLWGLLVLFPYVMSTPLDSKLGLVLQTYAWSLWRKGLAQPRLLAPAVVASLILLFFVYRGRVRIVITRDAISWHTPFGEPTVLRWVDVDEVYIRRVKYPLEGRAGERRILVLYGAPLPWLKWRPRYVVTDRQFEGYREAQWLAVHTAVPAIAERQRAKLRTQGGRIEFGRPTFAEDLSVAMFLAFAAASGLLSFRYGSARQWDLATAFAVVALLGLVMGLKRLRWRWYAVDLENFYVVRRGRRPLRIPISWITDAYVDEGLMVIRGKAPGERDLRTFAKDRRFFRNRGVMLTMIRLAALESQLGALYSRPATMAPSAVSPHPSSATTAGAPLTPGPPQKPLSEAEAVPGETHEARAAGPYEKELLSGEELDA